MMNVKYKLSIFLLVSGFLYPHNISESDKSDIIYGSLSDYIFLGAKHMITGYDHILFLVGVIFFLSKYSDIIKFVTIFTLGHSLTLIFATIFKVSANYFLIDAVIAFSVIYKGFENLDGFKSILKVNPPNLLYMIFLFGLIHGFGLSTRLQQLNLYEQDNLILSILSFNVGVEFGQIGALLIVYPILLVLKDNSIHKISKYLNFGLVIAGIILLIFQLKGFVGSMDHHIHNEPNVSNKEDKIHKLDEHSIFHKESKEHSHD